MNEQFAGAKRVVRVELAHEREFALGELRVHPAHCEVTASGWAETLEPRVMQVLVALAREKGAVVSRDELIEACWEGRVVGEDAISRCIGRLRKLAERSVGAFTVDTVSRVGYRLKVAEMPASRGSPDIPKNAAPAEQTTTGRHTAAEEKPKSRRRAIGLPALGATGASLLLAGFALWWFWSRPPAASQIPLGPEASVAVLPFANMTGDPAKEYFSDGFSEELLDDLSNLPGVRAAARTSSFAFKNKNGDVAGIARALRVRTIVEGSVRETGNRVRITAELIDAATGYRVLSAKYDRGVADILTVQDEIARAIAAELTHRLVPSPPQKKKIAPETYRLYLKARRLLAEWTPESDQKALSLLRQVVKNQPDFPEGLLALSLAMRYHYQFNKFRRADSTEFSDANDLVQKALSLDPHNLGALTGREVYALDNWNWREADSTLRVLLGANRDNNNVLHALRVYYFNLGFPSEALAVAQRINFLNPDQIGGRVTVLIYLNYLGSYAESIELGRAILAREPKRTDVLDNLCEAYAYSGQKQEAHEIEEQVHRLESREDTRDCDFNYDVAFGDLATARKIVASIEADYPDRYSANVSIAEYYIRLRDFDKASDWFEQGYAQRAIEFLQDVYWPAAAEYHKTARWKALTQQPAFREWQAEHDRIAAALAAHKDPLN